MKKILLLLAVMVVGAISCQKNVVMNDSLNEDPTIKESTSPYAISEEEALVRLDSFMEAFDGSETRSQRRKVMHIRSLSMNDIYGSTRANLTDDIENLLYIVEFENGEGSAILGADRRLEPVYAVLDKSVLTIDDFNNAIAGENTDDISTFTAGLIANEVSTASFELNDSLSIHPPGGGFDFTWIDYITVVTRPKYIEPLLDTKWSQTDYYNDKFPRTSVNTEDGTEDDRQCAGCTTIALAQILNNNSYPSPIELNNHTYYWRDINKHRWNAEQGVIDSTDMDHLASFIFDLSEDLRVTYNSNGSTSASVDDVKRVMRRAGYSNFSEGGITEARIYPMLLNQRAVWARGSEDNEEGHAWVIDGWKTVNTSYYRVTYNTNDIEISRELLSSTTENYVHCNMGWGAVCDGYYTTNIFDTTRARNEDELEVEYGDDGGTVQDYVFAYGFNTLTYSF